MIEEHFQKHTISEIEHFPEHGERKETLEFRSAKHELESVEHLPCFISGLMDDRESHHIFERAFWNGLDLKKVCHFLFHHFDFHGHVKRDFKSEKDLFDFFFKHYNGRLVKGEDENGEEYEYWTCDDTAADTIYNQLILNKKYHRGDGVGAHGCTTPTFFAWMAHRDHYVISMSAKEYEEFVRRQGK